MSDDYFTILGVERDATTEQIRSAYRRLSKKIHPDAQGSTALFRQVHEAYETLIDPSSRARYVADLNKSREQSKEPSSQPWTEPASSSQNPSSRRPTGSTGGSSAPGRSARRANEFGKQCEYCGWWVEPGAGVLLGNVEGEWRVVHLDGRCPKQAAGEEEHRKAFARRTWQIGGVAAALMFFMASGYLFLVPLFAAWHLSRRGWDPNRRSRAAVVWVGYVIALWWLIDPTIKNLLGDMDLSLESVWFSMAVGFVGAAVLWRLTPLQQPHRKEGA